MSEILIVLAILFLFFALSFLPYTGGATLFTIGIVFIVAGLVLGVPIGFYYHILLFRRKGMLGEELKNWWISPHRFHGHLPDKDRRLLNRWFWIGAMFFNLAMLGCGLVFVSLLVAD